MTEQIVYVYVDLDNNQIPVGRLYARFHRGKESASFEYERSWLKNPYKFALEPSLSLHEGQYHTGQGKALFGSIGDSAPDRWGRNLIRRNERRLAKEENRAPRTITELEYLLQVNDLLRQGALRFTREVGGPFLKEPNKEETVPPLIALPKLFSAAHHISKDEENFEDIRELLAPGSSLGGARPKASVLSNEGKLLIAKFSHPNDEVNLPRWEALALTLAKKAKINVPTFWVESIQGHDVLLLERFDRNKDKRKQFLSAMSMLGAQDNEHHSYLELTEVIRRYGLAPKKDLEQLWRRLVFTILISNTDDHLRNHGFLLENTQGWCLSPAYDLNPTPIDIKPRYLTTAIDEEETAASIEVALETASFYGLSPNNAKDIVSEVAAIVKNWRPEALTLSLKKTEIERMSSAFEHLDLKKAINIQRLK